MTKEKRLNKNVWIIMLTLSIIFIIWVVFMMSGGSNILPTAFKLSQNYPNPFNPTTFIRFSVPQSGMVSLDIFNLMGQKVRTLVREEKAPGHYEVIWNGKDENGFQLSSGIYIYQLKTDKEILQKKMLLIR